MQIQFSRRWAGILALLGLTVGFLAASGNAAAQTTQRPLEDFLAAQGTNCVKLHGGGKGNCYLFVRPDPNFLGWNTDTDLSPVRFAGVDYAGLAYKFSPFGSQAPSITGSVTERVLADGRAEVTVLLQTKNANVWVIELDLAGDVFKQIDERPTLFGHRPRDVRTGSAQALADSNLQAVFTIPYPGAPLPDLLQVNGTPDMKFLAFTASGKGPLTAEFGVAEGTPGKCTIVQTGLLAGKGKGTAVADGFPVESIDLKPVGQ